MAVMDLILAPSVPLGRHPMCLDAPLRSAPLCHLARGFVFPKMEILHFSICRCSTNPEVKGWIFGQSRGLEREGRVDDGDDASDRRRRGTKAGGQG